MEKTSSETGLGKRHSTLNGVYYYLASRSVIEAPVCQLSAPLSRFIIQENPTETETCKLKEALADQKRICSFDLPFGFGLSCQSSEELNQPGLLAQMHESRNQVPMTEAFRAELKLAEETIWKSGHCSASTWLLQPNTADSWACKGVQRAVVQAAPKRCGGKQGVEAKYEAPRSKVGQIRCLWVGPVLETSFENSNARIIDKLTLSHQHGCSDHVHKELADGFPPGLHFFGCLDVLPLAKAVQERRHLKSFINKVPIWIHFAIDILLVECAVVGTLMSLFIHEGGGRITGLRDFMLHEVSRLLDNLSDLELDLLENLYKYNGGF